MATPAFTVRPAEISRARGRASKYIDLDCRRLSPRPLAVKALPQPDRLGHPLSLARDISPNRRLTSALSEPWIVAPARTCLAVAAFAAMPPAVRCRARHRIGPPHTIPREGDRAPLHPECLPSSDRPRFFRLEDRVAHPQAVPSLWSSGADAFSIRGFQVERFDESSTVNELGRAWSRPAA
jgi:hypothetical protein